MSLNWTERNEAWEGRARALGERAVLHVGHKTPEAQAAIYELQKRTILPLLTEAVKSLHVERVLDFGCGVGRWTHQLTLVCGGTVYGVDPTQAFLDVAEAKRESDAVYYKLYQGGRIPLVDGYVDVVFACMVLSTILDVSGGMFKHTVREIDRVLRRGGLFFLVDNTAGPPHRPVVRSPFSVSRTIPEYEAAFAHYGLRARGGYEDLGEINTVFWGYKP